MKRFLKWCKEAKFGLILSAIAFVFILSISFIAAGASKDDSVAHISSPTTSDPKPDTSTTTPTPPPVIEDERVNKPFNVDATIARYFFDPEDSTEIKSQALISYDNKVMPSFGVDYVYSGKTFDVVASFSGKVIAKSNDPLYGLTVVIECDDGLVAYYSGLTEVDVYQDEMIKQGDSIGKSGESVINSQLGSHLHFALKLDNNYINPLKTYNKVIKDL